MEFAKVSGFCLSVLSRDAFEGFVSMAPRPRDRATWRAIFGERERFLLGVHVSQADESASFASVTLELQGTLGPRAERGPSLHGSINELVLHRQCAA